jgi:hypothetical protein
MTLRSVQVSEKVSSTTFLYQEETSEQANQARNTTKTKPHTQTQRKVHAKMQTHPERRLERWYETHKIRLECFADIICQGSEQEHGNLTMSRLCTS